MRGIVRALKLLPMAVVRTGEVRLLEVAGSLAYTTLLALVPVLTVSIIVMAQLPFGAELGLKLKQFLISNLLPEASAKVIATATLRFAQKAGNLTLLGTGILLVTAVMLLHTVERAFNGIWGVGKPRAWAVRLVHYLLVLTLGPAVAAGMISASVYLLTFSLGYVAEPAWVRVLLFKGLSVSLVGVFCALIYRWLPNARVRASHAAAGGLLAAVLLFLLNRGLEWYLATVPSYTVIYGAFAAVPIFLLWLYLSWAAVLLGAVYVMLLGKASRTRST